MIQSHRWIYETYSSVVRVVQVENGSVICYDADDNVVDIDLETAEAKSDEHLAEKDLAKLRAVRNIKLSQSDWTQMGDVTLSDAVKTEWETYRQALRDITDSYSSLDDVVWPTKPE